MDNKIVLSVMCVSILLLFTWAYFAEYRCSILKDKFVALAEEIQEANLIQPSNQNIKIFLSTASVMSELESYSYGFIDFRDKRALRFLEKNNQFSISSLLVEYSNSSSDITRMVDLQLLYLWEVFMINHPLVYTRILFLPWFVTDKKRKKLSIVARIIPCQADFGKPLRSRQHPNSQYNTVPENGSQQL